MAQICAVAEPDLPPMLLGDAERVGVDPKTRLAKSLGVIARARVANAWHRMAGCAIVAAVAFAVMGEQAPLYWFAGLIIVLAIERSVYLRLLSDCAQNIVPKSLAPLLAWTVFQSVYGNAIAVLLWFHKYYHGEVLAAVYLLASLANSVGTLRSNNQLMVAAAGPTALILLALPICDFVLGGGRQLLDLMPLVAGVMFCVFGANLWNTVRAADAAQLQAEAALLRERQAAAAATAAKTDVIQRMNDELRTPMLALAGAAEHLRRIAQTPEARTQIASLAHASELLRTVLADLSDLDRIENNTFELNPTPVDPRELVRGVVTAFRPAAQDKGLEFFLDISADAPPLVEVDGVRLRQILFNLIANAIKHTQHGGVRVRLQVQPSTVGWVRLGFVVADTGIGMSRSQLALVLGRERVAADGVGPGLGLAIATRLARLMGARLGAKSDLGAGSVFTLVLDARVVDGVGRRSAVASA